MDCEFQNSPYTTMYKISKATFISLADVTNLVSVLSISFACGLERKRIQYSALTSEEIPIEDSFSLHNYFRNPRKK